MNRQHLNPVRRILSIAMAGICLITGGGFAYAAEGQAPENGAVVVIRTAADLLELAQNSTSDAYSRNRTFALQNDIDLSGVEFAPIAIFAGVFEGNHHRITGLEMAPSGADWGFIRFTERDAVIRNLTVAGEIRPEGSMEQIGGIVGTNRGRVEHCAFEGRIVAKKACGGIAGYNTETGVIESCTNQGDLVGTKQTGGIAGRNEGTVAHCTNRGAVNATAETVHEITGEETAVSLSLESDSDWKSAMTDDNKITHIGGIAGSSSGTVDSCTNRGVVGYPHMGYKVGGIVGYHQGHLTGCHNYGNVSGRKDVGGIVGQLEPHVTVVYEQDAADRLRGQGDDLELLLDDLSDLTDSASDTSSDNMDAVGDAFDDFSDTITAHKDYYKGKGEDFRDGLRWRMDNIENTIDDMGFDTGVNDFRRPLRNIKSYIGQLDDLLGRPGGAVEQPIQRPSLGYCNGGSRPDRDIGGQVDGIVNQVTGTVKSIGDICDNIVVEVERLEGAFGNLGDDVSDFSDDLDRLDRQLGRLKDYVRSYSDDLGDDLDRTDEDLTRKKDALSDQIERLNDDMKDSREQIREQLDRVSNQLRRMSDTTADGFDSLKDKLDFDPEEDDWYEDISDTDALDPARGTLFRSVNKGEVVSDSNGGGIAGSMALDRDPESDFSIDDIGEKSMRYDHYARATVLGCENAGAVTVKNSYAGGIVGRSSVGAIIRCANYGAVESTDGDYAGGIAGRSGYLVRGCYALSEITGNRYAGGITGYGMDARDNCSMVSIYSESGEKNGSIMGDADEGAVIHQNFFVDAGIAAVDNLTYESAARVITYENLLEMDDTPAGFRTFTVRFVAGGNLVRQITCSYGQNLLPTDIPPVPDQNGKVGVWQDRDLSFVDRNIVIHAVYSNWITTVATDEPTPVLLVAGTFYDDTALRCSEIDLAQVPPADGYTPVAAYRFQMESASGVPRESMRVRVLADGVDASAVLAWSAVDQQILPAERDGRYLVFSLDGMDHFALVQKSGPPVWAIAAAAGVVLLAAIGAGIGHRRRRSAKNAQRSAAAKAAGDDAPTA